LTFQPGLAKSHPVRRWAAIFLVVFYVGLGTGVLHYLHELDHAREDAREDAAALASGKPVQHHDHDDCDVCAQFNVLVMWLSTPWTPLLAFLGLLVAILALLPIPPVYRRAPVRIDCRGPPALPIYSTVIA